MVQKNTSFLNLDHLNFIHTMKQYLFNNLIQKIQQVQWLPLFVLYNVKYTNLHEWDKRW